MKENNMMSKAQDKAARVTINLKIKVKAELPEGEKLYITGNLPQLGNWKPDSKQLEMDSSGFFNMQIAVNPGSILECKLTRGSWKTQAITDRKKIPPDNLVIKATGNRTVNVTIHDWLDQQVLESDPVKGKLLRFNGLRCRNLKYQRQIQIWLPESYSEKAEPYGVIYMHDCQNLFEPAAAFAGVDWKVDETVSRLLEADEIRPCIVVGIPNSPDRMKELNLFTRLGKAYARFVVEEVKPFIESRFNVSGDRYDNAIMGSSMGGLMSLQMLLAYSQEFALAGCLSSAFEQTGDKMFAQVRNADELPLDTKIYLDTGEFEPPIAESFFTMTELLKERGFVEGENLLAWFDEEATHSEAAWAARLEIPLKFLFGK